MAGHEKRDERAQQRMAELLASMGRELRTARLGIDLSQASAARAIGRTRSTWSRMELGEVPQLSLVELGRAMAVVGMDLHVRAYPGGQPLRDSGHVCLLERLRVRLGPGAWWRTEVPLPQPGDQRAWDALVTVARVRVGVEAETRARDAQALQRRLALKQRDGNVDRLVLLLSDTRHNRLFLRSAGDGFLASFPVPGALALQRLEAGADPGGNAIILL
jgi:transcriptional regulator with XRE-family HTH domain